MFYKPIVVFYVPKQITADMSAVIFKQIKDGCKFHILPNGKLNV